MWWWVTLWMHCASQQARRCADADDTHRQRHEPRLLRVQRLVAVAPVGPPVERGNEKHDRPNTENERAGEQRPSFGTAWRVGLPRIEHEA